MGTGAQRRSARAYIGVLALAVLLGMGALPTTSVEGPNGDYGDAPDGDDAKYIYIARSTDGKFPSVLSEPDETSYALHRSPSERGFLGQTVTLEDKATVPDLDLDDGWVKASFVACSSSVLELFVTVRESAPAAQPLYLNMLADWNHDGQWSGASVCERSANQPEIPEWSIRNLPLHKAPYALEPGFVGSIELPAIKTAPRTGALWVRFTLSTTPVNEGRSALVQGGGQGWDGAGTFAYGETEDYFTCLLSDRKSLLHSCPLPGDDQTRLDPPPIETRQAQGMAPQAQDDSAVTDEEVATRISATDNDSDPDGDELSVETATDPLRGAVEINSDGTLTYIPDENFSGTDTFTYIVCDPNNQCDSATVTVTVNPTNDPPTARDDAQSTLEDEPIAVATQANDSEPDGDALTLDSITQPEDGTASINDDGTVTYVPDPDFTGTNTFTYTVCDPNGACDTATVTISVSSANDTPLPEADTATTSEDESIAIDVLANDADADGDPLTVDSVTQPASGTVTVNDDGTVTYTPDPDFDGTDTFTYTVCDDAEPPSCATATVTVDVQPVNDPPLARGDFVTTPEETEVTLNALANDADVDGELNSQALLITQLPIRGSVTVNPDGTFSYTPDPNFSGSDNFEYQTCDTGTPVRCDLATVQIAVNAVNDPPAASTDAATLDEDSSTTLDVLANDDDADGDPLTLDSVTQPGNGTVTLGDDGSISYTPDPDFNGIDTFTYTVCDPNGECDTTTVTMTIDPVNDAPVSQADLDTTQEDTETTLSVLANDTDVDGDELTLDSVFAPANGSIAINTDGTLTYTPNPDFNELDTFVYRVCDPSGACDTATASITVTSVNDPPVAVDDSIATDEDVPVTFDARLNDSDLDGDNLAVDILNQPTDGTVALNTDGTVTYTPDSNVNGSDTFTYTICDPSGACDTATVDATVDSVNDAPLAEDDSATTPEDTPVTIDVPANDSDVDGNLDSSTMSITGAPSNGSVAVNADGSVGYTPDPDFNGTDSFSYEICDTAGACGTATVTVTVDAVNDAPAAQDDADSVNEDGSTTLDVLANDIDADGDTLTVDSVTQPNNGTIARNEDGTVSYTPDPDFNGMDTFSYETCDADGICDTATVTVTVDPVNDGPVANDDTATTQEDTETTFGVLGNDTDVDGDTLTVDSVTQPANGTVTLNDDGTLSYAPDSDFNGADSFTYTACDPSDACSTATVTVTVNPVNDAPVATDDAAATQEDEPMTLGVLSNDTDIDGDALSVDGVSQPDNGTVTLNDDGTLSYTPDPDSNGTDTFTYTICDPSDACDTATVSLTVNPVDDAPTANDDSTTTQEDTAVTIDVPANDADADGNLDPATVTVTTAPTNGTVTVIADGTVNYAPDPDFNGTDTFVYEICDVDGVCDTATVNATINAVDDLPVANDDAATTPEDTPATIDVPANDSDVDGNLDPSTVSITGAPANGSVTVNADGTVNYAPDPDFNGTDTFGYELCDTDGACDTATVTVTVNAVNDAPVATDDSAATQEDTETPISVLGNDTDVDGDTLTVDNITQADDGSVVIDADGTVSYTPDSDFNGTDTFTYTICDPSDACDTATVTLAVNAVDDPPVAQDDAATLDEDSSATLAVLVNDSDVDGDALSVDSVTQPSNGTVAINADGSIGYTPDPDFNGTEAFTYTVCDPNGACDTATVSVTIEPVNDAPVAKDNSATTEEDTAVTIDVPTNDSDVDGNLDPSTVSITSAPSNGSVTVNADGSVGYTPDSDFNGDDSFSYEICDADGICDTAAVALDVGVVNDAPVANDNSATTEEDTAVTIDVPANDSDVDGNLDSSTVSITSAASNGSVTVNADGSVGYSPDPNFNGTDTFTYEICDNDGDCDTATVTVTVNAVNDAPVATDDSAMTEEDTAVTIDVPANDSDVDGNLDPTAVTITSAPANGSVTVNAEGTVDYTPDPDFNGTDTFSYEICDTDGVCETATVTVGVAAVDDAPVATDDSATTQEDTETTISVRGNDSDVDGDTLTVDSVTQPANGTVTTNADGTVSYTPDADFIGTDTFSYTVCDPSGSCDTAAVDATVNPVNDAPVANDNSATTEEDAAVTIDVPANDADVDGNLDPSTVSVTSAPSNGSVTVNADGTIDYTPDPDFNGTDTFTYEICDTDGVCATATANTTVDAVNDVPVANDDSAPTPEDTPTTIEVLANDSDVDGNLDSTTVTVTGAPRNGSVTANADGTISYTPDPDFNGNDSYSYEVCDTGGACDTATVAVTVEPVNDVPVAQDDLATMQEDAPTTFSILANDVDVDGEALTVDSVTQPANGTVSISGDGTLSYTPDPEFNGNDSFTYTVCDPSGECDTATLEVRVDPVNDPPIANDDSATTPEDTPTTIDVLANDSDVDGNLDPSTVSITSAPTNGSVTANADGTVDYTPDPDFNGNDSFGYEVCDTGGACDTATVAVTVEPVNDAPVAEDDLATMKEDEPTTLNILANDADVDGDTLTVDSVAQPANGTVSINGDGTLSYTPDPEFNGTDSFTYTVCDPSGECNTATVNATVEPVDDPPVANDDAATTPEDTPTTIEVLANDSDVDGNLDSTTVTVTGAPRNGSVTANADGTIGYAPDSDFNGNDSFGYEVCDTGGACDTATVAVTVEPVNDAPVADDDSTTTEEDTAVTIDLATNDSDLDGNLDPSTVSITSAPSNGSVTSNADGSVGYTPDPNFNGDDSFGYEICDAEGVCDTGTATVRVTAVNDVPTSSDDSATVAEDGSTTLDVLANDSDADGGALTVDRVTQPANGTVSINGDGTLSYTPDPEFNGNDSFSYTVCDPSGACDTATVATTVEAVNDTPVAADDSATTPEDTPTTLSVLRNDTDVDGDGLAIDSVTQPGDGRVTLNADGTLTYAPDPDFHGSNTLTYTVCDPSGACDTATVTVTVDPVNDPPLAADDTGTTDEDTPLAFDVLVNDADVDSDKLALISATQPDNATVTINADGTVSYDPDPDFNGTDSFTYSVCDPSNDCDTSTVTVTVAAVNDAPVASADSGSTPEDTAVTINVATNDADVDGNLDPASATVTSGPSNGAATANGDGTVTYTPDPDFSGSDAFSYEICDTAGLCDTAIVDVRVTPVNDPPQFTSAPTNTSQEIVQGEGLAALDAMDVENDPLTYSLVGGALPNGITLNADGTFSGTANPRSAGTYSVDVEVSDGQGGTDVTTLDITVESASVCSPSANWNPSWEAPSVSGDTIDITLDASTPNNTGIQNAVIRVSFVSGSEDVVSSSPTIPEDWSVGTHPAGTTLMRDYTIDMASDWSSVTVRLEVIREDCKAQHIGRSDEETINK